jgi:hypothetical protein
MDPSRLDAGGGAVGSRFALFWTLVGIVAIIVGIRPRTPVDIAYHIAMVAVLVWGLAVARRAPVRKV